MYKHIYGPIPSRRLGVSLGVDPIPHKTCPLNCIYCECGATNNFTTERKEYIPTESILSEIDDFLEHNIPPDYITFSGSGEPTLHSRLGEMLAFLKKKYPHIKLAVLTNSIMLHDKALHNELLYADLIAPSLDAVSEDIFRKIDAPARNVDISRVSENLKEFAVKFLSYPDKQLWIEIFVVDGLNDTNREIARFIDVLKSVPYSIVQLNRLDRAGTMSTLQPASMKSLLHMKQCFIDAGLSNIEIIGKCKNRNDILNYQKSIETVVLESLARRSLSLDDLQIMSGMSAEKIGGYLDILQCENKIIIKIIDGKIVYTKLNLQQR